MFQIYFICIVLFLFGTTLKTGKVWSPPLPTVFYSCWWCFFLFSSGVDACATCQMRIKYGCFFSSDSRWLRARSVSDLTSRCLLLFQAGTNEARFIESAVGATQWTQCPDNMMSTFSKHIRVDLCDFLPLACFYLQWIARCVTSVIVTACYLREKKLCLQYIRGCAN